MERRECFHINRYITVEIFFQYVSDLDIRVRTADAGILH